MGARTFGRAGSSRTVQDECPRCGRLVTLDTDGRGGLVAYHDQDGARRLHPCPEAAYPWGRVLPGGAGRCVTPGGIVADAEASSTAGAGQGSRGAPLPVLHLFGLLAVRPSRSDLAAPAGPGNARSVVAPG
jgi:hypothetical protein